MSEKTLYRSPAGRSAVMALYDAALDAWPVPFETRILPTRHGDTHVIISGPIQAPPLVLLHGAGTNAAVWNTEIEGYSRHYRVFAFDILGEPGKSAEVRPSWDGPAYGEWLADGLDALDVMRTHVVGFSQGGFVALKFATMYPDRVMKLGLLSPAGVAADNASFIPRAILYSLLGSWGAIKMTEYLSGDGPISPETAEVIKVVYRAFRSRMDVSPLYTDQELARLTMPVMLVMGDRDRLRDAEKLNARLEPALPDYRMIVVRGAGHLLTATHESVVPFLDERL